MSNTEYDEDIVRCKTIIVGNSGVGKTSIISRYLRKFNPNERSTIGASFTNRLEIINDNKILFEMWDTAGQEKFRSINSIFYQDANICILVYDITNQKSFEELKDYWYNSVLENSSNDIIFQIVGNKIDLFDQEVVDRKDVEDFCKQLGTEVNFVSAKDENSVYIDELFKKLAEKFLNSDIFKKKEEELKSNKKNQLKLDSNEYKKKQEQKRKKCC
jgi:small GTP-binding protein